MEHEIKVSYYLTDEDLENIVVTALEGGIGYWACLDNDNGDFMGIPKGTATSEWCWQILQNGGSLHFFDAEDIAGDEWYMDISDLFTGIGLAIRNHEWDGDMDVLDAYVADCIFQYAIFGSVIYG